MKINISIITMVVIVSINVYKINKLTREVKMLEQNTKKGQIFIWKIGKKIKGGVSYEI